MFKQTAVAGQVCENAGRGSLEEKCRQVLQSRTDDTRKRQHSNEQRQQGELIGLTICQFFYFEFGFEYDTALAGL